MNANLETSLEPLNLNNNLETRSEKLRNALHISLGLNSDDSLMNEDESIVIDSDDNFNDRENHVDDVDAVDAADEEEDDDNDEHYLEEGGEGGADKEMSNEFNDEDPVIGSITGTRFSNKDVMFDFYKEHAKLSGFCIIKRTSKKGGDIVRYVQYGCDRSRKPRNKHVTKRRNCRARINEILEENGPWRVSKVVKRHNHQLEPTLSRLMARHISLSKSFKRTPKDITGLRPSKDIRVAEVLAGGPENLELEDIHDAEGEGEGEGEGRNITDPRYVASRGRPRLIRYRGRIDLYFRSSQIGAGSEVRGNRRDKGSGRGGGRSGGRGGGRGRDGGGRGGGNPRLAEGIE
uniref:Protein FAR1-RELATED SEQUENCE 8-like n=1 Tax=Nicotiana tabacum TaxID=4097 RepID=A0A1S3XXG9_TOBAC